MTSSEIRDFLKAEVSRLCEGRFTPDEIADDEALFAVPDGPATRIDLDSLDGLELAFAIEQHTGMQQPPEFDYKELLTVAAIVEFVLKYVPPSPAAAEG